MEINKINYEQYAMDYLEGNLKGYLLQEMEAFLKKHPNIKAELDGIELCYLEEVNIHYAGKESLLKPLATPKRFLITKQFQYFTAAASLLLVLGLGLFYIKNNPSNHLKPLAVIEPLPTIDSEIVLDPPIVISPKIIHATKTVQKSINPKEETRLKMQKALTPTESVESVKVKKHFNTKTEPILNKAIANHTLEIKQTNTSSNHKPHKHLKPQTHIRIIDSLAPLRPTVEMIEDERLISSIAMTTIPNFKKASRFNKNLVKLGILPERKSTLKKNLREALVPEVFASK